MTYIESMTTAHKEKSRRLLVLILGSVLYLGLAYRIAVYQLNFLESDALVPYSFVTDLMQNWSNIHGWYTTPNLYVFPDLILMGLVSLLSQNPWTVHIIYTVIFLAFLPIVLYWNLLAISRNRIRNWATSLITSILFILALGSVRYAPEIGESFLSLIIKPGTHGGILIAGLAFTASVLGALQNRSSVLWVGLIVCLGGMSDELFKVQFLLPILFLTVLAAAFRVESRVRSLALILTIGISYMAGRLILARIKTTVWFFPEVPLTLQWESAQKSLLLLSEDLWNHPVLLLIALTNLFLTAFFLMHMFLKGKFYKSDHPGFLSLVAVVAACINATAAVTVALYTDLATQRYIFALYMGPFVTIAAYLALSKSKVPYYLSLPLAVLAIILVPAVNSFEKPLYTYPKDLACLDEVFNRYNVETGYSDYWAAKYISYLGRERVHLNQILPSGGPHRWLASEKWYENAKKSGGSFDVIVMDRLNPNAIREKTKVDPDAVERCGRYETWLYAKQKRSSLLVLIQ